MKVVIWNKYKIISYQATSTEGPTQVPQVASIPIYRVCIRRDHRGQVMASSVLYREDSYSEAKGVKTRAHRMECHLKTLVI